MSDPKDDAVATPAETPATSSDPTTTVSQPEAKAHVSDHSSTVAASSASKPAPVEAEEAPDPDEDDLDDLDDMLDEFSKPAPPTASSTSVPSAPSATNAAPTNTDGASDAPLPDDLPDDFVAQLQKEMAALMGEIDENPQMKAQMEALFADAVAGEGDKGDASTSAQKAAPDPIGSGGAPAGEGSQAKAAGGDDFQETIRKTMDRMKASGESASAAASAPSSENDLLTSLLSELAASDDPNAAGSDEDFSKMLLGMMEQLTNKEILYEPMKDLDTRFPDWMKENEGKVDAADWTRYQEQRRLVRDIVGRFEKDGYSDANPGDREFIVERMQEMQAQGQPPGDLVGDMKETQDALGDLDQGCPQQ